MFACLFVHCAAFAAGAGLIVGWEWAPLGAVVGAGFAVWDEVQERRRAPRTMIAARRGGRG